MQFDVRLPKDKYLGGSWLAERRDEYLLRPSVDWPLSVDASVWPSVFYSAIFREASHIDFGEIEVDPETDDGDYWLKLDQMKAFYESHKKPDTQGVFLAIQLFSEKEPQAGYLPYLLSDNNQCALIIHDTVPPELPPDSELLGYDVADGGGISGLTNCSYTAEEKAKLQPMWAGRLNTFGLLRTVEDAFEFANVTNERVREHAPFFVYGMSLLEASK